MTIRWTIAIYPAVLRDFSTSTELTMLMEILHHCWIVTPRVYEPWTDNYFRVKTTRARLFCDKPGKLPNKVHLEVDPLVHPVVHPPRKIPSALLETAREKLTEMEEDRIIVKEEESTPWVSSMLVIDKRKWKKRTLHSKDDVRIFIDPRYLNKVLKRTHYPMVTVEEVANRLSVAKSFMFLDMLAMDTGSCQWMMKAQSS